MLRGTGQEHVAGPALVTPETEPQRGGHELMPQQLCEWKAQAGNLPATT
jgi:hypothetical protein